MNDIEKGILRGFYPMFIATIRAELIAPLLYAKKIINWKLLNRSSSKDLTNVARITSLLRKVRRRSSMEDFLECLNKAGYDFCCEEIKQSLQVKQNENNQLCTFTRQPGTQSLSFVDSFAEKVKVKIHNSEARNFKCDFLSWTERLLNQQDLSQCSLSETRQRADCCFILLDSVAVIERTHSADIENLWKSPVFSQMENLISKTSNPISSRIRHHARYGVALFLGGKDEEGEEYIEAALKDAKTFLHSGRDIGNCMFALVNYKLKRFAKTKSVKDKEDILKLTEEGLGYFQNEDEGIRNTWRRVYLDKKISCHLALEPSGRVIENVDISSEDMKAAKECLCEMDKAVEVMDKRRKVHFYRAKAHLHNLESNFRIAKGYLEEALELCVEGGYESELCAIKEELGEQATPVTQSDTAMDLDLTEYAEGHAVKDVNLMSEIPSSLPKTSSSISTLVNKCISDLSGKLNFSNTLMPSSVKRKLDTDELYARYKKVIHRSSCDT
ncbi:uncharacterized protein LOC134233643 [Saccostrea cucullata]|uniref:uncharacterized protein LOC134233643 n=1 Tax=Saccostrea cuccullata TaxID=36930 RepID=UPI002ED11782